MRTFTLTLLAALLLPACNGADSDAPDSPGVSPAPSATPEPAAPSPPPPPAPTVEPGDPFHQATTRKASSTYDGFTFWGWSADGLHYAFETADPGAGAVECEGRYDLFVVDARTDKYADGGHVSLKHNEPEPSDGVCTPRDLAGAWPARRDPVLDKHGIVRGALQGPVAYQAVDDSGSLWQVATPKGPLQLGFSVDTPGRDGVMMTPGAGASYTLKYRHPGGEWTVLEPGTRTRETVHAYSLGDGFAFFSPDGAHGALFVSRTHLSFEGDRVTYMSNGLRVPAP